MAAGIRLEPWPAALATHQMQLLHIVESKESDSKSLSSTLVSLFVPTSPVSPTATSGQSTVTSLESR